MQHKFSANVMDVKCPHLLDPPPYSGSWYALCMYQHKNSVVLKPHGGRKAHTAWEEGISTEISDDTFWNCWLECFVVALYTL